jgi:hypothetical protein
LREHKFKFVCFYYYLLANSIKHSVYKIFLPVFSLFLIISCSNKTATSNVANQNNELAAIDSIKNNDIIKVGKTLTPDESRFFIRQLKLPPYRTDTLPQRILLIGDSMSKWLRYRLQDYCEKNGHTLSTVTWVSGNTQWFAQYDTLNYYIKKDSITYVFLVLGANELFIKDFPKHRAGFVDSILKHLSKVKWIWVGPPNWKKDKGINDFLLKKLGKEKFFLSKNLNFKRQRDGMHPTVSSCSIWVDSIVQWISNKSTSRIRLSIPDSTYGLKPDAVLLRPLEEN